jgi:hypothetical protein
LSALKRQGIYGEHTWNIVIGDAEQAVHDEACLTVVFTTKPHTSSLAMWDVPSPVVLDSRFTVKVGLKCSASCPLAGATIEIHDERLMRFEDNPWG